MNENNNIPSDMSNPSKVYALFYSFFLIPVMIFTVVLRKHLLRGITFGAVRK